MGLLRCWVIRGLILAVLAAGVAGAWVAHEWVSPERVRAALVAALSEQFPNADVQVESAHLRLFGGISVRDLRLTRKGDSYPFFNAPSAVIYHDKQQLGTGRLVVRKVELDGPTIHLERRADGNWNVADVSRPGSANAPVPTFVVRNATVLLTDGRSGGLPPIVLSGARFNLLNDPLPLLKIEAQFTAGPASNGQPIAGGLSVPVSVSLKLHRDTHALQARVEVPNLALTPDLAPAFAKVNPALGEYAAQLTAHVGVKAELALQPDQPVKYDVRLDVHDGRWEDASLPWPVEQVAASVHIHDGRVTVEKGTARLGRATAEFTLESRSPGDAAPPVPANDLLRTLEEKLDRFDLTVRGLKIDDEMFAKLPAPAKKPAEKARRMFSPVGSADVEVKFTRSGAKWERTIEFRPNRLAMTYEKFRYPVHDLSGWVKKVTNSDGTDEFRVQVTGTAGDRRVELTGRVAGEGPDPLIDLKIAGTDVPIDDRLFAALDPKYARSLRKLRLAARGDFVVDIHQQPGVNRCENTFRVRLYDGSANYVHFPYPLSRVRGQVVVFVVGVDPKRPLRPGLPLGPEPDEDRVELRDFEAAHAGGRIWIPTGGNDPMPGSRDRRLTLRIQGENCPIDADMRAAMAALKLDGAWDTFAPRGRLTFGADVEVLDRDAPGAAAAAPKSATGVVPVAAALPGEPPFDPVSDLKLTVNFKGPSITPTFFEYDFDELAGVLRYQGGKIDLARFRARHGDSRVSLDAAEVRFADNDEIWANLGALKLAPLVVDAALLKALPAKVRSGVAELKPRGPMELNVKHLVVKLPPGRPGALLPPPSPLARGQAPTPSVEPVLYWNAELKLAGAALEAGLDWRDVHGAIASVGLYEGNHLGTVLGNAWFDQATVGKQPVTAAKVKFQIRPQQPDPARPGSFAPPVVEFPDLTGHLYQGRVGGEARVVLADPVRYRLWLTASGVHLDELARQCQLDSGAGLRGLAQGKFLFENVPDPKTGQLVATGSGQVDVPSGRMYNLPVLMPLLKLLKLQAPDQTAFEEAHAVFELRGDRMKVTQLDLIGSAVSLGGSGVLHTSGDEARFEFYTIWSQALRRWLTTPLGGDVASVLSGNLLKIEMVKKNGETTYKPHMLPAITEPVKAVAERLRNHLGRTGVLDPSPTVRASEK
jgi:hypothetical protein